MSSEAMQQTSSSAIIRNKSKELGACAEIHTYVAEEVIINSHSKGSIRKDRLLLCAMSHCC